MKNVLPRGWWISVFCIVACVVYIIWWRMT